MATVDRDPPARLCVLTPEAHGALAVVRVWGPSARTVVDAAFRPAQGESPGRDAPGRPRFGRIGAGTGDEVVALIVPGEPPEVEIHCHGGPQAVALVVEALAAQGAERRQPAAWVRHSARSRVAAEALVDVARATTLRTAEILLEQAQGALEREAAEAIALAESDRAGAIARIDRLLVRADLGRRLIAGWSVALAGRPNVGKSRLFNALAGYDRAIVDPTPGTTRNVVTIRTAIDGWPVELADTAGLRKADDALESAGIDLARTRQAEADLIVLVLDRSEPLTAADRALLDEARSRDPVIVASKADLPAAWEPDLEGAAIVSAATGEGLETLASLIAQRLVADPPGPGAGVPFRPGHARRLERAREALLSGASIKDISFGK